MYGVLKGYMFKELGEGGDQERPFNEVARKGITDCRVPRTWFYMGWAKKYNSRNRP